MNKYHKTKLGESGIYNMFNTSKEHHKDEVAILNIAVFTILVAALFVTAYIQYGG